MLWWFFHGLPRARVEAYLFAPPGNATAWIAALAFAALYAGYTLHGLSFVGTYALSPSRWREAPGLKLFALPMALVTGIFEEAFFRRYLMDAVWHTGGTGTVQVLVSAIVFGLAHGVWALFGGLAAGIGATVSTTVLGAMLAVVYLLGGRALLPCIASHTLINLVIEPWLILAATSRNWGRR